MTTSPIYIINGKASLLQRKAFVGSTDGLFNEAWLQNQLFSHPEALPLKEISPGLGRVAPVCKELGTLAGPADLLFVTNAGQIILAETKLWRNPEARRTVVAQILDYAKELCTWRYEDLEREVARATGKGPGHLLAAAKEYFPDLEEQTFVDGVNHSLRTGDMLLLIIGDGIRTGTEALVGYLERYGSLRFSFGLVEVCAYQLGEGLLLAPRVLAKTEIVRRTVVIPTDVNGNELPDASLLELTDAEMDATKALQQFDQTEYGQWLRAFWQDYFQHLTLDDTSQPKPSKASGSTNVFFSMPPSGRDCWISAYLARSTDAIGVYMNFLKKFEQGPPAFEYLLSDREAIEREIGEPLEWISKDDGTRTISLAHKLGDWRSGSVREEQLRFLTDKTNRFINAFRPRLQAFFKHLAD